MALAVNEHGMEIIEPGDDYPAQLPVQQQASSAMGAIMQIAPMAMARPRNENKALQRVLAAADDSWYWAIPNRGEGLSVRGARSAVRHYRNVGVVPYVEEIMLPSGETGWRMTVLAIDMENVVIETSSATCTKPTRKKDEKDLAYEQRCFQQQLAFLGRIERNAIFKILPGEWQEQIKGAIFAKRKLDPLPKRINEVVQRCESLGVNVAAIKKLLGCAPQQMSEAQWSDLWGRTNAIKNEGFAVADAFPELEVEKEKPQAKGEAPADMPPFLVEAYRRGDVLGYTPDQINKQAMLMFKKPLAKINSDDQIDKILAELQKADLPA